MAYFLNISIVFSVYNQNLRLNNLKTRTATNAKISVFVEAIIYLLLCNLHDCTFNKAVYESVLKAEVSI